MARIISVHSFRGGTGKSNTTANLAALMVEMGQRVGVVDTDVQSPGIHVLFGLDGDGIRHTLNNFLWGECRLREAAVDVTASLNGAVPGQLFLIPSSMRSDEIARVLREGCDHRLLISGLREVCHDLALDTLIIDTHPGLNEETLLSIAISHALLIIMRPDQQDYEGTGVTVEVARELGVPQMRLLVNDVPPLIDPVAMRPRVEQAFGCPVVAVVPHSDEMMTLASGGLFVRRFPEHPITATLRGVAADLSQAGGAA